MTTNHSTSQNQVRRKEKAVYDPGWIKALLRRAPFGMLASCQVGMPYLKPTLFAYDEGSNAIYFHSALEGRTRAGFEVDQRACFCVAEMGRLLPAETAMEFGVEYASVVVFGSVSILADPGEARRGLQLLLDKYFPHLRPDEDYRGITPEELNITTVYRLQVEQWSGKQDTAPADHPGAYYYGDKG